MLARRYPSAPRRASDRARRDGERPL